MGIIRKLTSLAKSRKDTSPFPPPEEVYNVRVWAMMLSASMAAAMFGYDGAFIGSTLKLASFKREFHMDGNIGKARLNALSSHIVSTFQAGCFFGTIGAYPTVERFGMRMCFFVASFLFCTGAILQVASPGIVGLMYAGRALTGLGVGIAYYAGPMYVSMNSPPSVRGKMVGLLETVYQAFSVVGFWINYGTNENIAASNNAQWRIPVGFQLLPGFLLGVLMIFQPEAPRWLIAKGRREEGIQKLCYLRNLPEDNPYMRYEIQQIDEQLAEERLKSGGGGFLPKLKETLGPEVRVRVGLGCMMMVMQNVSGINALNYYSATLIENIGFTGTSVSLLATGVYGLEKAFVTLVFMTFFVDTVGRRKALIVGGIGASLGMYYLGIYTTRSNSFNETPPRDAASYVALLAIYWYTLHYAYSWNGIPFIFCAEIFPNHIRMLCITITTCSQWLAQFAIVYSLDYMVADIKSYTFIFYAVGSSLSVIFTILFIPETSSVQLEDMEALFNADGLFAWQKMRNFKKFVSDRANTLPPNAFQEEIRKETTDECMVEFAANGSEC